MAVFFGDCQSRALKIYIRPAGQHVGVGLRARHVGVHKHHASQPRWLSRKGPGEKDRRAASKRFNADRRGSPPWPSVRCAGPPRVLRHDSIGCPRRIRVSFSRQIPIFKTGGIRNFRRRLLQRTEIRLRHRPVGIQEIEKGPVGIEQCPRHPPRAAVRTRRGRWPRLICRRIAIRYATIARLEKAGRRGRGSTNASGRIASPSASSERRGTRVADRNRSPSQSFHATPAKFHPTWNRVLRPMPDQRKNVEAPNADRTPPHAAGVKARESPNPHGPGTHQIEYRRERPADVANRQNASFERYRAPRSQSPPHPSASTVRPIRADGRKRHAQDHTQSENRLSQQGNFPATARINVSSARRKPNDGRRIPPPPEPRAPPARHRPRSSPALGFQRANSGSNTKSGRARKRRDGDRLVRQRHLSQIQSRMFTIGAAVEIPQVHFSR